MNWPIVVREALWGRLLALGFSRDEITARIGEQPVAHKIRRARGRTR